MKDFTYANTYMLYFDQFNFDEFMESWQQSVPDGMTTSLEQLKVNINFFYYYNIIEVVIHKYSSQNFLFMAGTGPDRYEEYAPGNLALPSLRATSRSC